MGVGEEMSEYMEAGTNKRSVEYEPSETAMATAFLRALTSHDEREEVKGPDCLAEVFLTEDRKRPLKDPILKKRVMQNKITPGMYEFMIARTAFFDVQRKPVRIIFPVLFYTICVNIEGRRC